MNDITDFRHKIERKVKGLKKEGSDLLERSGISDAVEGAAGEIADEAVEFFRERGAELLDEPLQRFLDIDPGELDSVDDARRLLAEKIEGIWSEFDLFLSAQYVAFAEEFAAKYSWAPLFLVSKLADFFDWLDTSIARSLLRKLKGAPLDLGNSEGGGESGEANEPAA